jgi:hypothetical protein
VSGGLESQTYTKTSPLPANTDAFSTTGKFTITITLWDNNHSSVYATVKVVDGKWSVSAGTDAPALAVGNHSFQAIQTDTAGNQSAISNTFNVTVNPDPTAGGSGNDTIYANLATNNATLKGGAGSDTFVFSATGFGNDTISDFSSGDSLSFSKASMFTSLTDLMSHAQQSGSSVVITDAAHDTITLLNTKLAALTTKNVAFV